MVVPDENDAEASEDRTGVVDVRHPRLEERYCLKVRPDVLESRSSRSVNNMEPPAGEDSRIELTPESHHYSDEDSPINSPGWVFGGHAFALALPPPSR